MRLLKPSVFPKYATGISLFFYLFVMTGAVWSRTAQANTWTQLSSMATARDQFTGCLISNEVFVFGGNDPTGFNLFCGEKYNILTDTWSGIADNPHYENPSASERGVEELSGVALNGKFYVFGAYGGYNESGNYGVFNYNEMYDPATDTWTTLAKKPTTTAAAVAVTYENKIYLFGGHLSDEGPDEQVWYKAVEAYDPATNSWAHITEMPKRLGSMAVAVHNGRAYIIGGIITDEGLPNDEIMAYDFQTGEWIRNYCTLSPEALGGYPYATQTPVLNGKAYLVGGIEGESLANHWTSKRCIVFDIEAKRWELRTDLPAPRCNHLTVIKDNLVYVIGGEDDEGAKDSVFVYDVTGLPKLQGEYWFGSLAVDPDTHVPWGKRGTLSIKGNQWHQQWEDGSGQNTFSSPFTTAVQPDGSINIVFPDLTYNVAWNGSMMVHAGTALGGGGEAIDLFFPRAVEPKAGDVVGDYSLFGHWVGIGQPWDEAGWGTCIFNADGSVEANWVSSAGYQEQNTATWQLDSTNALVQASWGAHPLLIGDAGIHAVFRNLPNGNFGYNLFIERSSDSITRQELAGTYLVRFLETGPGGVPYTCGKGLCVLKADGTLSVDAYYSDGEHDVNTANFSVGPGNTFCLNDHELEGIISADKNLIFVAENTYDNPRRDYNWLGGIFLVRVQGTQNTNSDLNGDGTVNFADLHMFGKQWLSGDCEIGNNWCVFCDFNQDSRVDGVDLSLLAEEWKREE